MGSNFKVGDRVRVVRHCNWYGDSILMGVPVGDIRQIVKQTTQLASEGVDTFILEGDDRYFYTPINIEAAPAPIRTVTRREIVPGAYGNVTVERIPFAGFEISYKGYDNAHKLREAARIFNEIADVLEENAT